MSRSTLVTLLAVVLAASLFGCSKVPDGALTEEDFGGEVTLSPGETMEIVLEANMTTGYGWYVVDGDAGVVFESEDPAYESDSSAVGSPGVETLTFEAAGPGETELVLGYLKPWEDDVDPIDIWSVTVRVE